LYCKNLIERQQRHMGQTHAPSARKLAGTPPRMQVPSGLAHMGTDAGPDNAAALHLFSTSADCPEIPKSLACILHHFKNCWCFPIPRDAVFLAETTGWQTWVVWQLIHQACSHGPMTGEFAGLIDSANQEPQRRDGRIKLAWDEPGAPRVRIWGPGFFAGQDVPLSWMLVGCDE
jgi:hypothetical protein